MTKEEMQEKIKNAELEVGQKVFDGKYLTDFSQLKENNIATVRGIELDKEFETKYRLSTSIYGNSSVRRENILTKEQLRKEVEDLYDRTLKAIESEFIRKIRHLEKKKQEADEFLKYFDQE